MKKLVIEFCRKKGAWKTAYSGKYGILYIHTDTVKNIVASLIEEFGGDIPFKVKVQPE